MLVYVVNPDPTEKKVRKLEDVVFKNETLALGSRFFRCMKVSEADAAQDRILSEAGRGSPRLVFIARDYKVDSVVSSPRSASKIVRSMKGLANKTYVNKFDKMVKGYIKLLTKMDGLESVRLRIDDRRKRLAGSSNPSAAKKLKRDEKAYQEDLAKWRADEKKLLEFELKGDKKAQA
jgi:hypothetical protein